MKALLIGGPYDRRIVDLSATPPRLDIHDFLYHRLDDPDTGEYLGGYVHDPVVQGEQEREGSCGELRPGGSGPYGAGRVLVRFRDNRPDLGRRHGGLLRHLRKADQLNLFDALQPLVGPCTQKIGQRDSDGHGWVTTLFGIYWKWRCDYCHRRSRSKIRPDKR